MNNLNNLSNGELNNKDFNSRFSKPSGPLKPLNKEYNQKALLDPNLFALLASNYPLDVRKRKELVFYTYNHCLDVFGVRKQVHDMKFYLDEDPNSPLGRCGFCLSIDKKHSNEMFFNQTAFEKMPIELLILITCHEFIHVLDSAKFIKDNNIDFAKAEDLKKYIKYSRYKGGDWYKEEKEIHADQEGFRTAKNIYERAVHDSATPSEKIKFWKSWQLLDYNEKIEMAKHFGTTSGSDATV